MRLAELESLLDYVDSVISAILNEQETPERIAELEYYSTAKDEILTEIWSLQ